MVRCGVYHVKFFPRLVPRATTITEVLGRVRVGSFIESPATVDAVPTLPNKIVYASISWTIWLNPPAMPNADRHQCIIVRHTQAFVIFRWFVSLIVKEAAVIGSLRATLYMG